MDVRFSWACQLHIFRWCKRYLTEKSQSMQLLKLISDSGPAVPVASFVTLADPDAVRGSGTYPVCCDDATLVSCMLADIQPAVLGQNGVMALPNDILVTFVRTVGANSRSFYYEAIRGKPDRLTTAIMVKNGQDPTRSVSTKLRA
jgi:hypothetical protein